MVCDHSMFIYTVLYTVFRISSPLTKLKCFLCMYYVLTKMNNIIKKANKYQQQQQQQQKKHHKQPNRTLSCFFLWNRNQSA